MKHNKPQYFQVATFSPQDNIFRKQVECCRPLKRSAINKSTHIFEKKTHTDSHTHTHRHSNTPTWDTRFRSWRSLAWCCFLVKPKGESSMFCYLFTQNFLSILKPESFSSLSVCFCVCVCVCPCVFVSVFVFLCVLGVYVTLNWVLEWVLVNIEWS